MSRASRLHVFSHKGRWYWWLIASNGRPLACCPRGFTRSNHAVNAAIELLGNEAPVVFSMPEQANVSAAKHLFEYHNRSLGDLLLAATTKAR